MPIHTRAPALLFQVKRIALQIRRTISDHASRLATFPRSEPSDAYPFLLSEQRSALWGDEAMAERRLQLGKVQNLRIASQKLNGLELPANALFSFWKHVGVATRLRGYTTGRELREGCLIPAVGGGLCQLSNTLYAAALDSGAAVVERHAHSRVVPGSAAEIGRDATVAFNYVDLRFRFDFKVRIEAALTRDELIVRFLATAERTQSNCVSPRKRLIPLLEPQPTGSCVTCGQEACFRQVSARVLQPPTEQTAFLLGERSPEFAAYVEERKDKNDALFLPIDGVRFHVSRYAWRTAGFGHVTSAPMQVAREGIASRLRRSAGASVIRAAHQTYVENLAATFGRKLRPEQTHLVVSQDLLPGLWRNGCLGGRTFDVLMTRLPIALLQSRLDAASELWVESRTLGDYRTSQAIARAEADALAAASKIVTAHSELARLFGARAVLLPWETPTPRTKPNVHLSDSRTVIFPGPTVGRKGCYAVRDAARQLDLEILLLGKNLESEDFWRGVRIRQAAPDEDWMPDAAVVVQPSLWEGSPRLLLKAFAAGIPVIVTPGCGIGDREGVTAVDFGDSEALIQALSAYARASASTYPVFCLRQKNAAPELAPRPCGREGSA